MTYNHIEHIELVDIESPEFIASSLHLLKKNNWIIKNFNYEKLEAEKSADDYFNCRFKIEITDNNATIECVSEKNNFHAKSELDKFLNSYKNFLTSTEFDAIVSEIKYHYFLNNPIQLDEEENVKVENNVLRFYKGHKVTSIIILLNVIVFAVMVFSGVGLFMPETADVIKWGGNFRPLILDGEWWRLIACTFIHIGLLHIIFNMWALYNIGIVIEPMIGSGRFVFAYFVSGIVASLNSIVWHYATPSAGASGAIFGMFGLFAALLTTNLLEKGFRVAMLKSVMPMIILNLILGTSAMIDNAGHIGGLLAGVACGYLFAWHYKFPQNKIINFLSFIIPVLITAISVFIIFKKLPNPYKEYQTIMANIYSYDSKAIELEQNINNPDSLKKAGYYWDKAIEENNKSMKMEFNKENTEFNEKLAYYLNLRKKQLRYIKDTSNKQLYNSISKSIDSVMNKIKFSQ
ncbi:MAG: rhomboid family intramembrane serine protease [Bacteroidia bacterium]|nr:rhomboid family intramembrane serine protease [Bacteroidia bacterium]